MGELDDRLWNDDVGPAQYGGDDKAYLAAVLDQYKLYVEMADRVSHRRAVANTFFLTLNTALLAAVGSWWADAATAPGVALVLPFVAALGQCTAWFSLVRSYRLLNSAKFEVIGALEARLPASPYWRAEWVALGEGEDRRKYWPLTHIERWVPVLFAAVYVAALVAVIAGEWRQG